MTKPLSRRALAEFRKWNIGERREHPDLDTRIETPGYGQRAAVIAGQITPGIGAKG